MVNVSEEDQPQRERRGRGQQGFRGRGPRGRAPAAEAWSSGEMERIHQFVHKHFPDRVEKLEEFKHRNPRAFRQHMREMMPRIRRMMHTMERDPEAGELMIREEHLNMEIRHLSQEYARAGEPEHREALRHEIRNRLEERFDVRVKRREGEIDRLERRLELVRVQLDRDLDHRGQRIEEELLDLGVLPE